MVRNLFCTRYLPCSLLSFNVLWLLLDLLLLKVKSWVKERKYILHVLSWKICPGVGCTFTVWDMFIMIFHLPSAQTSSNPAHIYSVDWKRTEDFMTFYCTSNMVNPFRKPLFLFLNHSSCNWQTWCGLHESSVVVFTFFSLVPFQCWLVGAKGTSSPWSHSKVATKQNYWNFSLTGSKILTCWLHWGSWEMKRGERFLRFLQEP